MLNENIKTLRKSKGLSQEELAVRLNVVRQTVSKWERGLSVPDSDMLIAISEALETPVSALLGENITAAPADDLRAIAEKLEVINSQLAERKNAKRRVLHWLFIALGAGTAAIIAAFAVIGGSYLGWDRTDPETAIIAAALHVFEYLFVRAAPLLLATAVVGAVLTRKKA